MYSNLRASPAVCLRTNMRGVSLIFPSNKSSQTPLRNDRNLAKQNLKASLCRHDDLSRSVLLQWMLNFSFLFLLRNRWVATGSRTQKWRSNPSRFTISSDKPSSKKTRLVTYTRAKKEKKRTTSRNCTNVRYNVQTTTSFEAGHQTHRRLHSKNRLRTMAPPSK